MTNKDFQKTVSEYIDIMIEHTRQVAADQNVPTTELDMLKIVEHLIRMKIDGVE